MQTALGGNGAKGHCGGHAALRPKADSGCKLDPLETASHPTRTEIIATSAATPGLNLQAPYYGSREYDPIPAVGLEPTFRHSGWAARRQKVFDALKQTTRPGRQQQFAECGANLWLQVTTGGDELRLVSQCCKDRFCSACAGTRARRINANLETVMKGKHSLFVTLTLRASRTPLADQLKRLYASFGMLRRHKFWREVVKGGCAFLEVKIGERSGLWHPHLHVIVESRFVDNRLLSAAWHAVTGDSSIVHVRKVDSIQNTASYVVKYVTKPASAEVFAVPDLLAELILALRGRRMILPFGSWAKCKLTDIPPDGREWKNIQSIDYLCVKAAEGDPESVRYFHAAVRKWPHLPWPSLNLPPPIDPNQANLPF